MKKENIVRYTLEEIERLATKTTSGSVSIRMNGASPIG